MTELEKICGNCTYATRLLPDGYRHCAYHSIVGGDQVKKKHRDTCEFYKKQDFSGIEWFHREHG